MSQGTMSGIPASVAAAAKKAEEEAAKLRSQPEPTAAAPSSAPAAPSAPAGSASPEAGNGPKPDSQNAASPAPAGESVQQIVERLQRENAELRRQRDQARGQMGGQKQAMEQEILELRRQLDALKASAGTAAAPGSAASASARGVGFHDSAPTAQPAAVGPQQAPQPHAPSPTQPAQPSNGTRRQVTREDVRQQLPEHLRDQYEDDLLDVMAAQQTALLAQIPTLQTNGKDIEARMREIEMERERQSFWRAVDSLHPGASAINGEGNSAVDPRWSEFLSTDTGLGDTFMDAAERAIGHNSPHGMAAIFDRFKAWLVVSEQDQFAGMPAMRGPSSHVSGAAPTGSGERRMIPQSEIDRYSAEAARGRISSDEADRRMHEYRTAFAEGRVYQDR